ncbi:SIR2 family protein [Acinetobacter guillouiae]|uniref:SIR2 family protein n=1 Tax=Acinetobacter guillouiae TaxID=106649 RepID=UPI0032B58C9A
MDIFEFVSGYKNHPVLFIGTGLSLRYLRNSFTWEGLLKYVSIELYGSDEKFYDLKSTVYNAHDGSHNLMELAEILEKEFNEIAQSDRNGKFSAINQLFYEAGRNGKTLSRFKIFVKNLLTQLDYRSDKADEIESFKRLAKNISSVVTTNYDRMIEDLIQFQPLIGNEILLSNPYGSIYKIHGCVNYPEKIILTTNDYNLFFKRYELIRAQLISLFVHNPIIFLGYGVGDTNIKEILSTIYKYVEINSPEAEKIRKNFLLVEYEAGSDSLDIQDHDILINGSMIRINKVKTDDYISVYKAIEDLSLPVSALEVRKVLDVVREIVAGGTIKVSVAEDIETLKNSDKVLAIDSKENIKYLYKINNPAQLISEYFEILNTQNCDIVKLLDDMVVPSNQWFPTYGFSTICPELECAELLKKSQSDKINSYYQNSRKDRFETFCPTTIQCILDTDQIKKTYKLDAIFHFVLNDVIDLEDLKGHIESLEDDRNSEFRKLLCLYDFKKYS